MPTFRVWVEVKDLENYGDVTACMDEELRKPKAMKIQLQEKDG